MKLYELSTAYNAVAQQLEDAGEADLQCLTDTLDSIQASIEEKAQGISQMIKMVSDTTAIEKEIERLQGMKRTAQNKEKWLKQYLQSQMELMGKDKIKTDLFTVTLQNNPPSLDDFDPSLVPAGYQKVEYSLDREKILNDLKRGIEVPGCAIKQSKGVRIR